MSAAELIYNACLRAERRLDLPEGTHEVTQEVAAKLAIQTLREEIGRGMDEAYPR